MADKELLRCPECGEYGLAKAGKRPSGKTRSGVRKMKQQYSCGHCFRRTVNPLKPGEKRKAVR